jgi:hypothetical protein
VDLTTPEGIDKFVASLQGMDKGRQELLKDFLASSDGMAKDEMAGFARALHSAETGKALFKRAVISGHSNGRWVWGDENGAMLQRTLYLRHCDNITKEFTEVHGTEFRAGYEAAKSAPISYAGLKRDKALANIAAYPKAGDAAHTLLVTKLKNLDGIPMNWN